MAKETGLGWTTLSVDDSGGTARAIINDVTNFNFSTPRGVQDVTGIGAGETDLEMKYSLETVNCIGCCALGPVIDIDGKIHGNVTTGETAAAQHEAAA